MSSKALFFIERGDFPCLAAQKYAPTWKVSKRLPFQQQNCQFEHNLAYVI